MIPGRCFPCALDLPAGLRQVFHDRPWRSREITPVQRTPPPETLLDAGSHQPPTPRPRSAMCSIVTSASRV